MTPDRAPAWLLNPRPADRSDEVRYAMGACRCSGRRKRGSFIEKTLTDTAGVLRQGLFAEDTARRGILDRLDPRTKLAALVTLLVALSLAHAPLTLALAYLGVLLLALAARLPLGALARRVWLPVLAFTGVVVGPAALSIVTPGELVVTLWHWHGAPQGITAPGLTAAALVILRVACSVSLLLLVTLTTSWTRLLNALGAVGIPRFLVAVVAMAYRYVFLLSGTVIDVYLARRARSIGPVRHDRSARAFAGASAGIVFAKAHQLSEEVHQAMISRGFRGYVPSLAQSPLGRADGVAALVVTLACGLLVWGDHVLR